MHFSDSYSVFFSGRSLHNTKLIFNVKWQFVATYCEKSSFCIVIVLGKTTTAYANQDVKRIIYDASNSHDEHI